MNRGFTLIELLISILVVWTVSVIGIHWRKDVLMMDAYCVSRGIADPRLCRSAWIDYHRFIAE